MNEINKLEASLDSSGAVLHEIDTLQINTYFQEYKRKVDEIDEVSKPEERGRDLAFRVSHIYDVRKSMRRFLSAYVKCEREYNYSKEQLTHLKQDVSSKLIKDDLLQKYFVSEKEAVQNFKLYVTELKNWESAILKQHQETYGTLNSVHDSLLMAKQSEK